LKQNIYRKQLAQPASRLKSVNSLKL